MIVAHVYRITFKQRNCTVTTEHNKITQKKRTYGITLPCM